jgi:arabinogalactan oligomer / maltooligosaccharide transport system permease protein
LLLLVYIWNLKDVWKSANISEEVTYQSKHLTFKKIYQKYFPYFILSPIGIAFLFVVCMPILFTFLTAFLNYNRDHLPPGNLLSWVGFSNFKKLFTVPIWSHTFLKVLLWTIVWTMVTTLSTYFLGMFQALILNHPSVKCKRFFRTVLIMPWAVPQMVTLLVFRNLLNGQFSPINQFLLKIGVISSNIPFLSDALVAKATVIVIGIWLGFPMFMVMMLGVLSNLDRSLFEAAALDGAGKWQEFLKITFPLVMKATAPNLIMSMAANFNGFGMIYFLTQGGPTNPNMQFAGDTDILISWIYKLTLNQQMYDIAAVMSVLLFLMIGVVSFWNFKHTTSFKEL